MLRSRITSIGWGFTRSAVRPMAAFICELRTSLTTTPGMDYTGFKVASDSDLDTFARRIKEHGTQVEEVAAGEQPGLGRRLSFVVPTGHRIELFSEMALSDHGPMTRNPEIWREETNGMRVTRFDHCNL